MKVVNKSLKATKKERLPHWFQGNPVSPNLDTICGEASFFAQVRIKTAGGAYAE